MIRWNAFRIAWLVGAAVLAGSLVACTQQQQAAAPEVEEKSLALTPSAVDVRASFLIGTIEDMKVTESVESGTGRVVRPPQLHGTLKFRNTSKDHAARLLGGKIEYLDTTGKPIPLAEGRDTSFKFYAYATERLDPGMETSQSIEVPFPAAALKENRLRSLRLELAYIPTPYREETVNLEVSLGQ